MECVQFSVQSDQRVCWRVECLRKFHATWLHRCLAVSHTSWNHEVLVFHTQTTASMHSAGHESFTWICDCHRFHLLPRFSHISARCAYCTFFPQKLAFSMAILILFVSLAPISIRFCYLDHLVANRMAPSMCPDPCGTKWGSWFQAILYYISDAYLVFMRSAYFLECCIKMTCLTQWERSKYTTNLQFTTLMPVLKKIKMDFTKYTQIIQNKN